MKLLSVQDTNHPYMLHMLGVRRLRGRTRGLTHSHSLIIRFQDSGIWDLFFQRLEEGGTVTFGGFDQDDRGRCGRSLVDVCVPKRSKNVS